MASTSRADSRLLTAVKIARNLAAPYMTSANSGPLAPMKATRSPGRTSLRCKARATWLDRWSSSANEVTRPASVNAIAPGVMADRFGDHVGQRVHRRAVDVVRPGFGLDHDRYGKRSSSGRLW